MAAPLVSVEYMRAGEVVHSFHSSGAGTDDAKPPAPGTAAAVVGVVDRHDHGAYPPLRSATDPLVSAVRSAYVQHDAYMSTVAPRADPAAGGSGASRQRVPQQRRGRGQPGSG